MSEDNATGKINDERFAKMSAKYEQEQGELSGKIKALRAELEKATDKSMTSDMFLSTVRKYTRAKKLTPRMLNELVERIEVHQAEKVDGVHVQRLTIHYHCVGEIEMPDVLSLPVPDQSSSCQVDRVQLHPEAECVPTLAVHQGHRLTDTDVLNEMSGDDSAV